MERISSWCWGAWCVVLVLGLVFVLSVIPASFADCEEQSGDWGVLLSSVTSEGFTSDYNGYKFKVDSFVYNGSEINGVVLNVQKPDGSIVTRTPKKGVDASVDQIGLRWGV